MCSSSAAPEVRTHPQKLLLISAPLLWHASSHPRLSCCHGLLPPSLPSLPFVFPSDASLSVALVLAPCVWPLNFFQEGQFAMTAWAFAFPLNALAAAAVTMYGLSPYSSMQVSGCMCTSSIVLGPQNEENGCLVMCKLVMNYVPLHFVFILMEQAYRSHVCMAYIVGGDVGVAFLPSVF